ncbi:MAG: NAD(P)H-dependent oxidoreductase [Lachnospiraceae bacterium]
MNILILNASPKGKYSITIQTSLYLQKLYPAHNFTILHVGQLLRKYEKDFSEITEVISANDLIVFSYPVYTFLAPYQLHRFIELMKEHGVSLAGKFATQISTSKHFYDVTAHKCIEENCYDFGANYIPGLSADMDDLLSEKGQLQAQSFLDKVVFDIEHSIYTSKPVTETFVPTRYQSVCHAPVLKTGQKDIVIVTNAAPDDHNLNQMIADFKAMTIHPVREINLRDFPFSGGCLGCLNCATTAKCIYKDGFDDFLRNDIQIADAIIYAFTIENHYTHASFKCYDDRQFCNGHRSVTEGMPVGYIISGDYAHESNVQTLVNARSEVGGVYLSGVATDEVHPFHTVSQLVDSLEYALSNVILKPSNFYAVGGGKIFRDLVYLMQGMMKADHKFYKEHDVYDFPQSRPFYIFKMKLIGFMLGQESIQKKLKGKLNQYMIAPYDKVIEEAGK